MNKCTCPSFPATSMAGVCTACGGYLDDDLPRGVCSSYELTWPVRYGDEVRFAAVREIPVPDVVVVDGETGVLRARYAKVMT